MGFFYAVVHVSAYSQKGGVGSADDSQLVAHLYARVNELSQREIFWTGIGGAGVVQKSPCVTEMIVLLILLREFLDSGCKEVFFSVHKSNKWVTNIVIHTLRHSVIDLVICSAEFW